MPQSEEASENLEGSLKELVSVIRETHAPKSLTYEQIVGAVITAIVIGVGTWISYGVSGLTTEVTELKVNVAHLTSDLNKSMGSNDIWQARIFDLEKRVSLIESREVQAHVPGKPNE